MNVLGPRVVQRWKLVSTLRATCKGLEKGRNGLKQRSHHSTGRIL